MLLGPSTPARYLLGIEMVAAMSRVLMVRVAGLSTPILSAWQGTRQMIPSGPSTPSAYFLSNDSVAEMSMMENVAVPTAHPDAGVRLRVSRVRVGQATG